MNSEHASAPAHKVFERGSLRGERQNIAARLEQHHNVVLIERRSTEMIRVVGDMHDELVTPEIRVPLARTAAVATATAVQPINESMAGASALGPGRAALKHCVWVRLDQPELLAGLLDESVVDRAAEGDRS